ncbi:uncharacterized protein LOC112203946 [Rosa chinensis]|uniref:uncharacterized protein LOC112203946 n=1 Tax=Rosa chinensis TaxID=74649 RepID=UPI000D095713|nr:uncharacterized protein LOC112203946 [Rosa chinensis]
MAYSSSSISCSLEDLDVGVVKTFHPTDSDLVGTYLYNRIKSPTPIGGKQTFPEIEIYGTTGLPPWDIWRIYEPSKFPHQDYIYFFSRVKKLGSRCFRRIGCDGGTWSETEAAKPVYISGGIEEPYGKLRKFRYENNKDRGFEHHAAWLMDEFTINQAPDLALCRLKINDKGGGGRKKRKKTSDETNENHRKTMSFKNRKLEPKRVQVQNNMCEQQKKSASFSSTSTTQQLPPQCDDHGYCMDENLLFSPTGLVDDYDDILNSDQFLASLDQWYEDQQQQQFSDSSLLVPQQVEPNNSCEEQQQQQGEQQLCGGFDMTVHDLDIDLDDIDLDTLLTVGRI